jgi:hypothetical protein
VAFTAIGYFLIDTVIDDISKLTGMFVFVAGLTGLCKIRKCYLNNMIFICFGLMALPTIYDRMASFQLEICDIVIKIDTLPGICIVAESAIVGESKLFDRFTMGILMTSLTVHGSKFKTKSSGRLRMTGNAGNSFMSTY